MKRLILVLVLGAPVRLEAAEQAPALPSGQDNAAEQLESACLEHRWEEVLELLSSSPDDSADARYCEGLALAAAGRVQAARRTLEAGSRMAPQDPRFPLELAGVAYRIGRFSEARHHLRRALSLDPTSEYANDFMATLSYVEGATETAVFFWNRNGEPLVESVAIEPAPDLDPVLINRAIQAAPGEMLRLDDLDDSMAVLSSLELFGPIRPELVPVADDAYALTFRVRRRAGPTDSWVGALALLKGLPFETVRVPFYNLDGAGLNVQTLVRWDQQKRRLALKVARPVVETPQWRWSVSTDLRREDWSLNAPSSSIRPAFHLEQAVLRIRLSHLIGSRWSWGGGVRLSRQDYTHHQSTEALKSRLISGTSLTVEAQSRVSLIDRPDWPIRLQADGVAQFGRYLNGVRDRMGALRGGFRLDWRLSDSQDDWRLTWEGRTGASLGRVPFEELFSLAVDRDHLEGMRAHISTRQGTKGDAPMGSRFVLFRSQLEKQLFQLPLVGVKLAPFVDLGRAIDNSSGLGSRGWLVDIGFEVKLTSLPGIDFSLAFGRDLNAGRTTIFAYSPHAPW